MRWYDSLALWIIVIGVLSLCSHLRQMIDFILGKQNKSLNQAIAKMSEVLEEIVDEKVKNELGFTKDGDPK